MRRPFPLLLAFLFLPACAEGPSLQLGQTLNGTLDSTDQVSADGPYQDRWTFDGTAGQRLRIDMKSSDLDPYLQLLGPDSQQIAANDDALGTDAGITFRAVAAGRYTVFATTYGSEKRTGAYQIALAEVTGQFADPGAAATIAVGESKDGVLEIGDPTPSGEAFADAFEFRPTAAGTVVIDLTSSQFDTYLVLRDSAGTDIATDDDSGDELNARLTQPVLAGQTYRIVATTFGSRARTGAYTLAVANAPATP